MIINSAKIYKKQKKDENNNVLIQIRIISREIMVKPRAITHIATSNYIVPRGKFQKK